MLRAPGGLLFLNHAAMLPARPTLCHGGVSPLPP